MALKVRFCEVCRRVIEAERLESNTKTRLCLRHGEEIEKYGGEFIGTGEQGSLGKATSMKHNYGDVTVTWRRNEEGIRRLMEDYDRQEWERKRQQGDA
jgi:hypothetical protein